MRLFYDDLGLTVLGAMILVVLCVALLMGCVFVLDRAACDTRAALDPAHEYTWNIYTLCMVRTGSGRWISASESAWLVLEQAP